MKAAQVQGSVGDSVWTSLPLIVYPQCCTVHLLSVKQARLVSNIYFAPLSLVSFLLLASTFSEKEIKEQEKGWGTPPPASILPLWDISFKLCLSKYFFKLQSLFGGNSDLFEVFIISKARTVLYLVLCSGILKINWV